MNQFHSLFGLGGVAIFGWFLATYFREGSRRTIFALAALQLLLIGALAVSGWLELYSPGSQIHLYISQSFIIVVWLATFLAIGVAAKLGLRHRPVVTVMQILASGSLLAISTSAGITGYLGPSYTDPSKGTFAEATLNRFYVLHMLILPGVVSLLLFQSMWYFRPQNVAVDQSGNL